MNPTYKMRIDRVEILNWNDLRFRFSGADMSSSNYIMWRFRNVVVFKNFYNYHIDIRCHPHTK